MTAAGIFDDLARVKAPRQARSRRAFAAALDAFDDLLRERPLAAVSVQEVADRAGLSITSVYARFDGKSALVLALHERVIAAGVGRLDDAVGDRALAGAPVATVAAEVIGRAVDFADAHAHVFRAVLAAADDETNRRAAAFVRAGSERLARLLGPGVDEHDVDFAWRAAVAVLQQRWVLWGAEPSRFPPGRDELVRRLTRAFVAAVAPDDGGRP